MAIEQRSKDFNSKRITLLRSPTDTLMDDALIDPAEAMKDDNYYANSSSPVPFVCPNCSSASETIDDLQQQLAEALADAAVKEKLLQVAQQSIMKLQEDLENSQRAAAAYKQEFEHEKELREQLVMTLTEDSSKLVVPSKSFRRKTSESSSSSAVLTVPVSQAVSSPSSLSDGEIPANMIHPNVSSQSSRTNSSGSRHSSVSSLSGVFNQVTSLWTENQSPTTSTSASAAVCTSPTSTIKPNSIDNSKSLLTTPKRPADRNVSIIADGNAGESDKLTDNSINNANNTNGLNSSAKGRRVGLNDEQQGRGLKIQLELLTKNLSDLRSFIDNRNNMSKNNNVRISVA
jgi:hypothetical protein